MYDMKIPYDLFGVVLPEVYDAMYIILVIYLICMHVRCHIYLHNIGNICIHVRCHIYILCFISEEDATIVYQNASNMKMTGEGFVWLVTQQSFSGDARGLLPQGITTS